MLSNLNEWVGGGEELYTKLKYYKYLFGIAVSLLRILFKLGEPIDSLCIGIDSPI